MPIATIRAEEATPAAKSLPTEAARSESGLSRRSSLVSFNAAAGGVSDDAPATFEREEHHDSQAASQGTMIRTRSNATVTAQDDAETVSHHHSTPKTVTAARDEDAESSDDSGGSAAIFQQNPSSDTDTTIHKSPATSHEEPSAERDSKPARHDLLTSDAALGSKGWEREAVRASHASHLTLPYQHSEAGDDADGLGTLSKITTSTAASRLAPSKADVDDIPGMEMRETKFGSMPERLGTRDSRLLASASVGDLASLRGGSVRGGSVRGTGSRYAASYIEPASLLSGPLPPAGIRSRDSDRLSVTSRSTARKPASFISKMLKADAQFPGTRIRKYVEPPLNDAMRRVMRQFTSHHMGDHRCNGYPIAVFVGATAIDTGSVIQPYISAAVSLYFGPGHPRNMASLLPDEDRIPLHIPNPKAPTPASLSRRAELRSAITALHTIYELYRGRACAHVCIDSAYVAKAWGTWIPEWENYGWPGEGDESGEDYEPWRAGNRRDQRRPLPARRSRDGPGVDRRAPRTTFDERDDWLSRDPYADRSSRRGPAPSRSPRRGGRSRSEQDSSEEDDDIPPPGRRADLAASRLRLVDEDLLRELADIRYDFARVERHRRGGAQLYLIDRCNNPADRMARAAAKSKGNHLAQSIAREYDSRSQIGVSVDQAGYSDEEIGDREDEWMETRSRISSFSRSTKGRKGSMFSNSAGRLRMSASLPSGQLRGGPRRHLDTFVEEDEDEDDLHADDTRSVRSARSRKSTRAERERDDYLARQDKVETESLGSRSASRARRLAPPSERGSARQSMEPVLLPPESASRRGSMDSRRRVSNVRSQPNLRGSDYRPHGRSALADAAARFSSTEDEEEDDGPRRHAYLAPDSPTGPRLSRNRMVSEGEQHYPEMDDLVPPSRMWESGSTRSGRDSIDSRTGSTRRNIFAKSKAPPQPESPGRGSVFGLFKNSSSPSLRRMPAPEDPDYQWAKGKSPKQQKREWKSTTADDWGEARETSQWEQEEPKKGFFGRMFGRKK